MSIRNLIVIFSTGMIFQLFFVSCKQVNSNLLEEEYLNVEIFKSSETSEDSSIEFSIPYNLETPIEECNLPSELIEISALGYDHHRKLHVTVNDEKAFLYVLDIERCQVQKKYDFGSKGDYEGIESVGDIIYILKSNGNIYPFNIVSGEVGKTIKTPLSTTNDVEGIGYDDARGELILACKGSPNLKNHDKLKHSKAFYTYQIDAEIFNREPKFVIKDKELKELVNELEMNVSKSKRKKLEDRIKHFSPSAIAKHPISKQFYILSSVGRSLVICDQNGKLESVHFLNADIHSQPEGITFDTEGKMYISNEGRSLIGKIYTYDYIK